MSRWAPIASAPYGVTLLTKAGANLVFAYGYTGQWFRDDGRQVEPELWLEVAP